MAVLHIMARAARLALAQMRALEEEGERLTLSNPLRGKGKSAASAQPVRAARLAMADSRALEEQAERANPIRGRGATPSLGLSQFRGGLTLGADLATMPTGEYDDELLGDQSYGSGKHTLMDHLAHPTKGFGRARHDGARLADAIRSQHGGAYLSHFVGGMNTGRYEGEGSHSDSEEEEEMEMEDDVAEMEGGKKLTKAALRQQLLAIKRAHPEKAKEVDAYLARLGGRGRMAGGGFLDSVMSFISSFFGSKKAGPSLSRADAAKAELAKMGITSLRDFTRWSLKNHPDKGGDTGKFQSVSDLAGRAFKGEGRRRRAAAGPSDGRRARAAVVKKVMAEKGLSMIAASKYVKEHGLF